MTAVGLDDGSGEVGIGAADTAVGLNDPGLTQNMDSAEQAGSGEAQRRLMIDSLQAQIPVI